MHSTTVNHVSDIYYRFFHIHTCMIMYCTFNCNNFYCIQYFTSRIHIIIMIMIIMCMNFIFFLLVLLLAAVQYLTSATVDLVNRNALNVTCNIEVTNIEVNCFVSVLSQSSGETVEKSVAVTTGSSRSSVNFMVTGLSEGIHTYTVRAVNGSNNALETFSVSELITVGPPPTPTTRPPNASPKG